MLCIVKVWLKVSLDCSLDFDFYEHCVYGKHNWVRFPYGATREKGS
jgi:hypothetical protein